MKLLLALTLVCACFGAAVPPGIAQSTTFAAWADGYGLTGPNSAPDADPDGDGIANLMEYAIAEMNPTVADSASPNLPRVYVVARAVDGTYAAPTSTPPSGAALDAAASLHLAIRWAARPGVTGIRYVPKVNSPDLEHWAWGDSAIVAWADGTHQWARSTSDAKVWTRMFMRLAVEIITPTPIP